jgi:hypothetical protein
MKAAIKVPKWHVVHRLSLASIRVRNLLVKQLNRAIKNFQMPETLEAAHFISEPPQILPIGHSKMAGAEGLEPTALGFGDRCSTN